MDSQCSTIYKRVEVEEFYDPQDHLLSESLFIIEAK